MSMYVKIYETLCPYDRVEKDDPRRNSIIREMRGICRAKNLDEAIPIIEWWGWKNREKIIEFIKIAKKLEIDFKRRATTNSGLPCAKTTSRHF